jgi:hypothetical protein
MKGALIADCDNFPPIPAQKSANPRLRRHQTIRMAPAMAAGITDHMWSMRELLETA